MARNATKRTIYRRSSDDRDRDDDPDRDPDRDDVAAPERDPDREDVPDKSTAVTTRQAM